MAPSPSGYRPPYTITPEILNRVGWIGEAVGRLTPLADPARTLRLRRVSRVRTIRGSLAIEGNRLGEAQITAILDGKRVIAPPREILEVRNALAAYDRFDTWRPERETDVLEAHRILMAGLIAEAGVYRRGGVGVLAGQEVIHLAPPANRVPDLMQRMLMEALAAVGPQVVSRALSPTGPGRRPDRDDHPGSAQ